MNKVFTPILASHSRTFLAVNSGPLSVKEPVDSSRTLPQVKSNAQPRAIADILPEVLAHYGLALEEEKETPPPHDLPAVLLSKRCPTPLQLL